MNRRELLQASLAAGVGAAVVGSPAARAARTGGDDDLNVAIIGAGTQGRVLLDAARRIPGVRFRAVADIWGYSRTYGKGRLKRYYPDVEAYEDYREMLAKTKDLDAVIVATPDFMHAEHTIASLKAGLHVYCEKMMSNDLDAARSMVAAMRKTGKLLQVGHQRRSNPRYLHALERIVKPGKMLGRLTHAEARWNRAVAGDLGWPAKYLIDAATLKRYGYASMREFRNWRWFTKYGGGPISDLGSHQIDVFNWFLGRGPSSVMAAGGRDYYTDRQWHDNVMAIYEYDTPAGRVRAFYEVLTTTSAGGGYAEQFMGTAGSLKISELSKWTQVFREAHAEDWTRYVKQEIVSAPPAPRKPEPGQAAVDVRVSAEMAAYSLPVDLSKPVHQPHLENFFDAIRGRAKLTCPADVALTSEIAVFKVYEALRAERKIALTKEDYQLT